MVGPISTKEKDLGCGRKLGFWDGAGGQGPWLLKGSFLMAKWSLGGLGREPEALMSAYLNACRATAGQRAGSLRPGLVPKSTCHSHPEWVLGPHLLCSVQES